jgi:hypothetical protein
MMARLWKYGDYNNNFSTSKPKIMKKIFTLLFCSLASLSLFAFDGARMSISTISNNMNLKIELDGQRIRLAGSNITLNNLSEGKHNFRVYRAKRIDRFSSRYDQDYEIIYATSVYLNRAYQVDITINGSGKVNMDTYRIDSESEYYFDDHRENDFRNDADRNCGNGNDLYYRNVMNAGEFRQVTDQIRKEWFDANRMISVKTIMDKNNFTTRQVKELMYLLTFESNKLELAKYAYRKTIDKENYWQLNDVFTFSSSKEELARFIRESR